MHSFWNECYVMTGPVINGSQRILCEGGVCYSRVLVDYHSSPILAGTTLPLCRHMARHGVASPMSGLHMSKPQFGVKEDHAVNCMDIAWTFVDPNKVDLYTWIYWLDIFRN